MNLNKDAQRARAEARFKLTEERATAGAKAKAEHDAAMIARDANTERLKGLRLARDEAIRSASETDRAMPKLRRPASW